MKKTNSKPLRKSKNIEKSHKALFDIIAKEEKTDNRPGEDWENIAEVAKETGLSKTTVREYLEQGVKKGMYEKVKSGACYWFRRT
jgi:response regulator of citrate/malate metabolism